MNYLVWILNPRILLRGKDYGCRTFLWKGTQKESFIFWLRSWSHLIMSSSSIRHFDFSQRCFTVFVLFNNLLHSAISLADNYWIIYSEVELIFFYLQNGKSISSTRKRNYCVSSRCAGAKLNIFLSAEKFLK